MAKNIYTVATTVADILDNPENGPVIGRRDSQILYGETFEAEREQGDWVYGTSLIDGYKGYARKEFLKHAKPEKQPAHFVDALASHIYPQPSFKTRPTLALSFLSRLRFDENAEEKDGFIELADGQGWVFKAHIKPLAELKSADPAETALRFAGVPYLYSGRTSQGLDCSGLVQLALMRCGIFCPKDADQQENAIGKEIKKEELKRGDLVYFPGHVGMMVDESRIINATTRTMAVTIEPFDKMVKNYPKITAMRRVI